MQSLGTTHPQFLVEVIYSVSESGLLTLAGGKITDYRKMAEGAMKVIIDTLNKKTDREFTLIDSKAYQVSGGHFR